MSAIKDEWTSGDGSVRLLLGDCLEILPTLGEVDAVVTDPPYGIDYAYRSYDDTRDNLKRLIEGFLPAARVLAGSVYVLCGPTQITMYPEPDWVMSLTWNTTGSFGKWGYNQWTPILCYGKDVKGFGSNDGILKSDVLRISGGEGVGFMRKSAEKNHPCAKPATVMQTVVKRLTAPGEAVLDCFMGSGTTGVVAVRSGRRFVGIEQDAEYFRIAASRLKAELEAVSLFEKTTLKQSSMFDPKV